MVESGSHDELLAKKGHFYDMLMLQAAPHLNETGNNNLIYNHTYACIGNRQI